MLFRLSRLWTTRRASRPAPAYQGRPLFRPVLEGFEDRVVPAHPGHAALVGPINVSPQFNLNLVDINIQDVQIQAGNLVAIGQIGNITFPIELTPTLEPGEGDCQILNLALGPINLDLLGLNVDTSEICVRIHGDEGPGNLLGNLLCGVGGLLDGDLPDLGIGNLDDALQGQVLDSLTTILDGVFGQLTNQASLGGVSGTSEGACDILNLSLGPIDLNLLGLVVEVDDCADGPVTLDITAEPGEGNLLGNLLCDLSSLLDRPGNRFGQVQQLLNRIGDAIGDLLANQPTP